MVSKLIEWIFHMELHEMSDNDHRILQSSGALNKSQFAPIYGIFIDILNMENRC